MSSPRTAHADHATRIALNTALLYARMVIVMVINLYTVRLVLNALGVIDYGIFDVVAGLILVLSSVSNVVATATQRYFAIALGERSPTRFQAIFSVSVVLYVGFAVLVVLLGETAGLWFVNHGLVIPPEKLRVANLVYQLSIFTFLSGVIHLPFSSAIITHEHLGTYAAVSIVESVLKLVAAFLIPVFPYEPVLVHGAALLLVALGTASAFIVIAVTRYPTCRFRMPSDAAPFRELLGFSGWSLFGSVAGVGLVQVISVLVNMFFGPAISTARAISLQLSNAVTIFSGSLMTAVKPAMIRSYSEQSFDFLNRIFNLSNKFIFFGLSVICLPLAFEMDTVLRLWLGTAEASTVLFSRLIIVYALIMALNNPISVVIQATGHVREYHLLVEPFTLLCVPATYLLFRLGYPAYTTYLAMIAAALLSHAVRLWCLKRYYPPFDLAAYGTAFVLPSVVVVALVCGALAFVHAAVALVPLRLLLQGLVSCAMTGVLVLLFGVTRDERAALRAVRR
ncbi:MAG: polysaccharide biosynthesis protein [Gemmatimonadaceae bacterium]